MKIAFAGLGVMGAPMARHLVNAGHEVVGFNRTQAKAQAWAEAVGARAAATVSEAAQGAELFILCVGIVMVMPLVLFLRPLPQGGPVAMH